MDPESPLPGGAQARAHLQPAETPSSNSIEAWLDETQEHAERLRRLLGDQELMFELQLSNFAPEIWKPVAGEFARYGLNVIQAWMRKGTMLGRVKQRTGYGLPAPLLGWLEQDEVVYEIACDTVVEALEYFKTEVLMKGKWDPDRGASLPTFYIGQCLYQFANVYRRAHSEEATRRANETRVAGFDELEHLLGRNEDVATEAGSSLQAASLLADFDNDTDRTVFALDAVGYSNAEIAAMTGLADAKAVENRLRYKAKKMRDRYEDTGS